MSYNTSGIPTQPKTVCNIKLSIDNDRHGIQPPSHSTPIQAQGEWLRSFERKGSWIVPPEESLSCLYLRYFLVPKKGRGVYSCVTHLRLVGNEGLGKRHATTQGAFIYCLLSLFQWLKLGTCTDIHMVLACLVLTLYLSLVWLPLREQKRQTYVNCQ